MLTITLPWWIVPLLLFLGGAGAAAIREATRDHSGYMDLDFLSPLFLVVGVVGAIGVTVGHFI